jgi:hypothetical protein
MSEGKNKMSILNAIRNKLLARDFVVIHRGVTYQENYNQNHLVLSWKSTVKGVSDKRLVNIKIRAFCRAFRLPPFYLLATYRIIYRLALVGKSLGWSRS